MTLERITAERFIRSPAGKLVMMTAQEYTDLLLNLRSQKRGTPQSFGENHLSLSLLSIGLCALPQKPKGSRAIQLHLILKKTAVLSPERDRLHYWLEDDKTAPSIEAPKEIQIAEPTVVEVIKACKDAETVVPGRGTERKTRRKKVRKKKEEPKTMSFSDWVIYSSKGKIEPQQPKNSLEDKLKLIDFLENQPKNSSSATRPTQS